MTQVKRVNELNLCYCPHNLTEEAKYRYDCIIKYKKLRAKGFDEKEALKKQKEDEYLVFLLNQYTYGYKELSNLLSNVTGEELHKVVGLNFLPV